MSNFKIIEEGRLSLSDMSETTGGGYTCFMGKLTYYVDEKHCAGNPGGSYSSCQTMNTSCSDTNGANMTCSGAYSGPTGPGGIYTPNPGIIGELRPEVHTGN